MQENRMPSEQVRAIQEQLCGFLLDEVINPKGEFYYSGASYHPQVIPDQDDEEWQFNICTYNLTLPLEMYICSMYVIYIYVYIYVICMYI